MTQTSTSIVNAAIELIGDNQEPVTGVAPDFDDSAAGQAASALYQNCVNTVGRQFGWDFSRNVATLQLSGNAAPGGWAYEYLYPTSGIQVRQVLPPELADPNDPLPINWTVGNNAVNGAPTKVIWSNEEGALAAISNTPPESLWDPLFTESVVRLLASELAMALEGRPQTAQDMLQSAESFEGLGELRDS